MYERVIIIGSSRLACDCAVMIMNCGIIPEIFDTNTEKSTLLETWCASKGLSSKHITWQDLTNLLLGISEKTLLISAFNLYLIPGKILDKDNLTAINCHHAILPDRPGRNGATWAIYEQDKESGITWHYAIQKADAGNILNIKKIILDNEMTALQLMKNQNNLAREGFAEIISDLLNRNIKSIPQDPGKKGTFRYSNDIPNGGFLDLCWDYNKMSAFLRSMDYGPLDVVARPRLSTGGNIYELKGYTLLPADGNYGFRQDNNGITISTEQGCIRLET